MLNVCGYSVRTIVAAFRLMQSLSVYLHIYVWSITSTLRPWDYKGTYICKMYACMGACVYFIVQHKRLASTWKGEYIDTYVSVLYVWKQLCRKLCLISCRALKIKERYHNAAESYISMNVYVYYCKICGSTHSYK